MPGFRVDGLPPNKAGGSGKSMWRNEDQARRLIALRNEAHKKLGPRLLTGKVRLTLKVHVGIPEWESLDTEDRQKALIGRGDLDNFVAGVCDGLAAAHDRKVEDETWDEAFNSESAEIRPSEAIAYKDDSWVFEIRAAKVIHSGKDWYEIALEDLGSE